MKKEIKGVVLGVLGVLLFSSKAVFVKLMYAYDIKAIDVLILRMGYAFPVYLFFLLLDFEAFKKVTLKDKAAIIVMGFIGYYLASFFDFKGLEYISASLERLVLFAYPTFVVILSYFIFKKPVSKKQWLAIALTYLGVVVIFSPALFSAKHQMVANSSIGVGFVLLSALTYGSYLVFSQQMMTRIPVRVFTSMAMVVSSMCTIIHYILKGDFQTILNAPNDIHVYGVVIAVFATIIPSYFISSAISKIGASKVAILGALGPVSTITLAYLLLGEYLMPIQIVGAIIIVIGVFQVKEKKKNLKI